MDTEQDTALVLLNFLKVNSPNVLAMYLSATPDELDAALASHIAEAVDAIERNANNFTDSSENNITTALAFHLRAFCLEVTQEENTNGHVDITFKFTKTSPVRRRLGEAKIYKGPKYHVAGLEQLVSRYSTGREGVGYLFEYFKQAEVKTLVEKVREYLDDNKPCHQEGESQDHHFILWAFTTVHKHNSGEMLHVLHLNCNLYRDPAAAEPTASSSTVRTLRPER